MTSKSSQGLTIRHTYNLIVSSNIKLKLASILPSEAQAAMSSLTPISMTSKSSQGLDHQAYAQPDCFIPATASKYFAIRAEPYLIDPISMTVSSQGLTIRHLPQPDCSIMATASKYFAIRTEPYVPDLISMTSESS